MSLALLAYYLFQFYLFVLIARLVLEYVRMFARSWQPRGVVLLLAELVYTLTDPPLNFVRRFVPPLRLGAVAIDLSFFVVFFAVSLLMRIVPALLP